jgi:hypothetical protein
MEGTQRELWNRWKPPLPLNWASPRRCRWEPCTRPIFAGQAYLLARNGSAAVAEFQKFLDHRGIVVNFSTGALVHLQQGRAYAISGDTARAKAT